MVRLFRRIRRELIEKGRLNSYFLYAFGELFLIVLGILIALQINNWNENRKAKVVEKKLLNEFNKQLKEDALDLYYGLRHVKQAKAGVIQTLEVLEADVAHHDSLNKHFCKVFWLCSFLPNTSAYENLTSRGQEIIRNDSLRIGLTSLYNSDYKRIEELSEYNKGDVLVKKYSILITLFNPVGYWYTMCPVDFEALKDNMAYKNTLYFMLDLKEMEIKALEKAQKKAKHLIRQITEEVR